VAVELEGVVIALKYPFSVDVNGHVATVNTYAQIVRGQLVDVLMTNFDERVMRPAYGSNLAAALFDPSEELVQVDAANQVIQRVNQWASRVVMRRVAFSTDTLQPGRLFVDVDYQAGAFDEARSLRMPVSTFLSEETPI
jgi:phage baseplate assembly protein W